MEHPIISRSIGTVAIGKSYQKLALNLFYSFVLYNKNNDIKFSILTDSPILIENEHKHRIDVIISDKLLYNEEILLNKIIIDQHVLADQVLLIDADSLIFSNLEPIFNKYKYENFVMWAEEIKAEDKWMGDIDFILKKNNIDKLYMTVGGLYLFRKSDFTKEFFEYCRLVSQDYDNYGLSRIYNHLKNDEMILSLACVKFGIAVLPYNSRIKAETMFYSRRYIDIMRGIGKLYYNSYEFKNTNLLLEREAYPLIINFDRSSVVDFDFILNSKIIKQFVHANFVIRALMIIAITPVLYFYYFFKYLRFNLRNLRYAGRPNL